MDHTLESLSTLVQQEVEDYARGHWHLASGYAISDTQRKIYSVLAVPDYPRKFKPGIVVMARVVDDTVFIDEDITDRPLVEELLRVGIPREKIVCTYLGEASPDNLTESS